MRKFAGLLLLVLLLMFALLMIGCGHGGGGTTAGTSSGGNGGGGPVVGNDTSNMGYIMINFTQAPTQVKASKAGSTLPAATNARVVIRRFDTDTTYDTDGNPVQTIGLVYKKIQDFVVPGSISPIPVPAANGYQVDIISYRTSSLSGSHKSMLKYGTTGPTVNVVSGSTSSVSLSVSPIDAGLTVPTTIPSGSAYTVSVNAGPPLRNEKNLRVTSSVISDLFSYGTSTAVTSFDRTAPALNITDPAQNMYFQGLFFLNDDLLDPATESWQDWRYYEPNPAEFSDPQLTATVTPPGGITINVTL
jgi:hypothetical protein